MFTGIVREVGVLQEFLPRGQAARVTIAAPQTCPGAGLGESICVNGTCLTVAELQRGQFSADLSRETLQRTYFSSMRRGTALNIEPSLRPQDRLGGHIVSGHVDGTGTIEAIEKKAGFHLVKIRFPAALSRYIAMKGCLCVDGISLTVSYLQDHVAGFAIVPTTWQHTNLHTKRLQDPLNLEIDMLARYVERLLLSDRQENKTGLTEEKLRQYGY